MSIYKFLRVKLKTTSFLTLIFLEIEGWLLCLCSPWPGVIGFAMRNLILSILTKSKTGMAWVQPRVIFVNTNKITMGKNCGINTGTYINAIGGIEMGNYVLIGSNVTISSGMHPIEGIEPTVYERPVIPKKIIIEDDVWIGAGAVIMPGIRIRKGTVVGANAIVTKDTEEYSVVVGIPARKLRSR